MRVLLTRQVVHEVQLQHFPRLFSDELGAKGSVDNRSCSDPAELFEGKNAVGPSNGLAFRVEMLE